MPRCFIACVFRLAPLLNEMNSYLKNLQKNLEKEEEPELLNVVYYALLDYSCMLRSLEDGNLTLSTISASVKSVEFEIPQ